MITFESWSQNPSVRLSFGRSVLLLLFLCVGLAGQLQGQSLAASTPPLVQVAGRVLDVALEPLPGAEVTIQPLRPEAGRPQVRSVLTGADGNYRFQALRPGEYRLTVSQLGYLPTSIEVDVREAASIDVSVALEMAPITLAPVEVHASAPDAYGATRPVEFTRNRFRESRWREAYLVSDAYQITHSDVVAAVTLAETDLFRALQRVPGVGTRDDYTATIWTRGASWGQTRVYFDGLPLYNPTHAGWLFSAVNPDAISSVAFHPGYRSARWGEGAAGVLDLRSRSGRYGSGLGANSEVSFASARVSVDGSVPEAGLSWMLATRRSYVDVFTAMAEGVAGVGDLHIPYDFSDVIAQAELELGRGWQLESSTLLEYDHLRGDIPGFLEGNRGHWGNRALRLTAEGPLGPLTSRITAGGTDFGTTIVQTDPGIESAVTLPTLDNGIRHRTVNVEVGPRDTNGKLPTWSLGFGVTQDSVRYNGPFSPLVAFVTRDNPTSTPFRYGESLTQGFVWGEQRWKFGDAVSAITGLRMEFGDSVANGGRVRLAPRIAVRTEPLAGLAISSAWSRSYQYVQDVSPAGGPVGPQLHLSATWVLASGERIFPALRSDLFTLGVEKSWDSGWSLLANGYIRESSGVKVPNPFPGPVSQGRAPDAEASNLARGLEFSVRKESTRWNGSLSYSHGQSTMTLEPRSPEAPVLQYPSSADIRHMVDASALVQVAGSLRLGGALTYGSGVPFTRMVLGDGSPHATLPVAGLPNNERTPAYASLDLLAEYERTFGRWHATAYLQMRNVSNRANAITYSGTWNCPTATLAMTESMGSITFDEACLGKSGLTDAFNAGIPRLPLVGFRVSF